MTTATAVTTLYRSYLTVELNAATRAAISDPHRMHQLVSAGYAAHMTDGQPDQRAKLDLLYAVNTTGTTVRLVTQATVAGDWSTTTEITSNNPIIDTDPYSLGDTVAFHITAQPIWKPMSQVQRLGGQGKRRPVPAAQRLDWAQRKLTAAGLNISTITITDTRNERSRALTHRTRSQATNTKGHNQTLVTYQGLATVTDPAALRTAQQTGIGPGRAHGAGLLLLRPTPTTS